jgi:hypothetical protein
MSNYASHQTYQAPREESQQAPVQTRVDADAGMTTRVIIRDGVTTAEQTSSRAITAAEVNPYHGTDTVFETARGKTGWSVGRRIGRVASPPAGRTCSRHD